MKPRLWPAVLIVAVAVGWVGRTAWIGEASRQDRNVEAIGVALVAALALTVWLALLSRLPGRVRLAGVAIVVAVAGGLAASFQIRGVTGDLLPILEPRWAQHVTPAPVPVPESTPSIVAPTAVEPTAAATSHPAASAAPTSPPTAPRAEASYPQFLGPSRDAILEGPRLARDWNARPPRRVWRQPMGEGWAGFAVAEGRAITQDQSGSEERVVAYDAATGKPLWVHTDRARYATVIAGIGPRATPTLAGGRVFTVGATGILNALDMSTGRRLWTHDIVRENGTSTPEWGKSMSPLVVDDRVIVSAGGSGGRSLIAYDVASGAEIWAAGSDASSYSSPVLLNLAGRRQIVMLNQKTVAGHDPATGKLLWEHPFPGQQPNVAAPMFLGPDRLLVSVGYGIGSKAYRVAAQDQGLVAAVLWESTRLKSKFANLIPHEGSVYGLDDGVLTCIDPATGERRWKDGRYGHGQLLLVAGLLLVQTEEGEIVLVDPSAQGLRELTRFQALDGKTWNPPALAGNRLFVRNDREAALYELPVE